MLCFLSDELQNRHKKIKISESQSILYSVLIIQHVREVVTWSDASPAGKL